VAWLAAAPCCCVAWTWLIVIMGISTLVERSIVLTLIMKAETLQAMPLIYREDRTTQAAARLLRLRGGTMSYLKLVKLLYFADRRALVELGRPISYDLYVSMPHGPVLSRTLNLMTEEPEPHPDHASYWRTFISEPHEYEVRLLKEDIPNDQLSRAEEEILDSVFAKYGRLSRWEVRDLSHRLPEWQDPHGSCVPINIRDILLHQGMSEEDAQAIVETLGAENYADQLTS
jgi:uncharacterized phage-associated protein